MTTMTDSRAAEAQGGGEVRAWMRRWAFDGVDVMALPKKERPRGWHLWAITESKCLNDDVPLYTAPPSAPVEVEGLPQPFGYIEARHDLSGYDVFDDPGPRRAAIWNLHGMQQALAQQPAASLQEQANALGYTMVENSALVLLERQSRTAMACERGELWYWQGDGADLPDSLSCPVVMHANTLRDLLAAQQPASETVDAKAWLEALSLPEGYEVCEHLPGVWEYQFDIENKADEDSDRKVSGTSWNHPALAAIAAWSHAYDAVSQQPAAVYPKWIGFDWAEGKQPAAVDEEMVEEANERMAIAAYEKFMGVSADDPAYGPDLSQWMAGWNAALAAQPGGSDNDR